MSYMVKEDGKVEFSCHGCEKTKTTDSLAKLPKNWCVTGILVSQHHEEFRDEGDTTPTDQKLREVNEQLAAHFCSIRCAKKKLLAPKVREYVARQGITLVLYGKCETIVDGTTAKEEALKGSLAVGKLADITVLSKDIMTVAEDEIPSAQVMYTIVGGKIAYSR